jgi:16S rRNA (cytosine1402-N4)-methyltransferase
MEFKHEPIMLNECIENLNIKKDGIYVDGTLGGAGHSSKIVEKLDGGLLVGIDRDEEAIEASKKRLAAYTNVKYIHGRHEDIVEHLQGLGIDKIDGVLLDLGISSYQIDEGTRGFSYTKDAELDMRMDQTQTLSAKDIVNDYTVQELENIFRSYGEEKFSKRIAERIVTERKIKKINTTYELADIVRSAVPKDAVNSFKRIFQALRIEVNGELKELKKAIFDIVRVLNPGGRICIITFHSLEDRIVKEAFLELQGRCTCPKDFPKCVCGFKSYGKVITRKPIVPSEEEMERNPRSKSAKLRVFERS